MRFAAVLALALAGLTMTASAQKPQKTKPSHTVEKEGKQSARPVKEAGSKDPAAQELRRVEQSGARASGTRKSASGNAARTNPALRTQKKEANPPIHFASSGGSGKGGKSKAGDPYKGRLRHKGSRH